MNGETFEHDITNTLAAAERTPVTEVIERLAAMERRLDFVEHKPVQAALGGPGGVDWVHVIESILARLLQLEQLFPHKITPGAPVMPARAIAPGPGPGENPMPRAFDYATEAARPYNERG